MADTPVSPTPITAWPTAPQRTDAPATFVTRADAWVAATASRTTQMNSLATNVNFNATSAFDSAAEALSSSTAAVAAANYKGNWSALTGALNIPASVTHDSKVWLLKVSLPDVTASEPSAINTDWLDITPIESLPSQTGNSGKFLTTDGTDASWGNTSAITATASGALANGDKVVLNSDGTVSKGDGQIYSIGSVETIFNSNNIATVYTASTFDSVANNFVMLWRNNSTNALQIMNASVSGTTVTQIGGANTVTANGIWPSCAYDAGTERTVVSFANSGTGRLQSIVFDTSTATPTAGTAVNCSSAGGQYTSTCYDSTNGKVVVSRQQNSPSTGTASVGTVTAIGNSIAFGTQATFVTGGQPSMVESCFDSTNGKVVIAFSDGGAAGQGTVVIGTVSGTDITFGTKVVFTTSNLNNHKIGIDFDPINGKVLITYRDVSDSNKGKVVVGTVSGTSISFGTPVIFNNATTTEISLSYDAAAKGFVIAYENDATGANLTRPAKINGTSVTLFNENAFVVGAISAIDVTSGNEASIVSYRSAALYADAVAIIAGITNVLEGNFVGISSDAVSDAGTAIVQTIGAIDDAQSGLTAGETYYLLPDGTLSTTAGTPSVVVGTAISATEILIKG